MRPLFLVAALIIGTVSFALPAAASESCDSATSAYLPAAKAALTKLDTIPNADYAIQLRLIDNAQSAIDKAGDEVNDDPDSTCDPSASLNIIVQAQIYEVWLGASIENSMSAILTGIHASTACRQLAVRSRDNALAIAWHGIGSVQNDLDDVKDPASLKHATDLLRGAMTRASMKPPDFADTDAVKAYAASKMAAYEAQKAVMTEDCIGDNHGLKHSIAIIIFGD